MSDNEDDEETLLSRAFSDDEEEYDPEADEDPEDAESAGPGEEKEEDPDGEDAEEDEEGAGGGALPEPEDEKKAYLWHNRVAPCTLHGPTSCSLAANQKASVQLPPTPQRLNQTMRPTLR